MQNAHKRGAEIVKNGVFNTPAGFFVDKGQ
jgi:hypothetical protein